MSGAWVVVLKFGSGRAASLSGAAHLFRPLGRAVPRVFAFRRRQKSLQLSWGDQVSAAELDGIELSRLDSSIDRVVMDVALSCHIRHAKDLKVAFRQAQDPIRD
jgi:hypothetical protein